MDDNNYIRLNIDDDGAHRQNIDSTRDHSQIQIGQGTVSGTFQAVMRVLTPLHVGTGEILAWRNLKPQPKPPNHDEVDITAPFIRENGQLTIPGSSLKGAFRHMYEAITKSCLAQTHRRHRPDQFLKACYYRADSRAGNNDIELCPACRVFGAQGYMGQVTFAPATPISITHYIELAPQRWEPKIRPEHEYTRKIYTHGISEDALMEPLEVVDTDSTFDIKMTFRNLDEADLGVILLILGQDTPTIYPKLGAAKAHGFGAVQLEDVKIELIDVADYISYESSQQTVEEFTPYLDAAKLHPDFLESEWMTLVDVLSQKPEGF